MSHLTVRVALSEADNLLKRISASQIPETVAKVANEIVAAFADGNKVILMGNGGSSVDAIHIAGEFTGRFTTERIPLPAMSLTTDTAALTCIANDYGYENVFERQIRAWAKAGDVVIGLSTSGNSENVIEAITTASLLECVTVSITGEAQSALNAAAQYGIRIPSTTTARIQEATLVLGHSICQIVDDVYADMEATRG